MKKIITTALLFAALTSKAQTIIYVNSSSTGTNNGTSWANAYTKLYNALQSSPNNSQIWVAQGTYYPTSLNNPQLETTRGNAFQMKNNVGIYGGFVGTETSLTQRDWKKNITVMSGDIGLPSFKGDNVSRVISNVNLNNTAVLDGFTITGGYSVNNYPVYSDGAGMYNDTSSPTLRNLVFTVNEAFGNGGGMANGKIVGTATNSNPTITNVVFERNKAANGGGIYNSDANPIIKNALFVANVATQSGGAIENYNCSGVQYVNVTIYGNTANIGGGIYNDGNASGSSAPNFQNCIVWANVAPTNSQIYNGSNTDYTIQNCDVQGGFPGSDNIDAAPQFINSSVYKGLDDHYFTADDGFTIKNTSPCVDAGSSVFFSPLPIDIQGFQRSVPADMGAYEARIIISQTSGNWENTTTWLNSLIPTKNDYTTVSQGHTVTVTSTSSYPSTTADVTKGITVKGTLKLNASSKTYISN